MPGTQYGCCLGPNLPNWLFVRMYKLNHLAVWRQWCTHLKRFVEAKRRSGKPEGKSLVSRNCVILLTSCERQHVLAMAVKYVATLVCECERHQRARKLRRGSRLPPASQRLLNEELFSRWTHTAGLASPRMGPARPLFTFSERTQSGCKMDQHRYRNMPLKGFSAIGNRNNNEARVAGSKAGATRQIDIGRKCGTLSTINTINGEYVASFECSDNRNTLRAPNAAPVGAGGSRQRPDRTGG